MKTFTIQDIDSNFHDIEADGYGFNDMDCMVEFQVGGSVVFAIPLTRIAWIKVKVPAGV